MTQKNIKVILVFLLIILFLAVFFMFIAPVDCKRDHYFLLNMYGKCFVYDGCESPTIYDRYEKCNLPREELIGVIKSGSEMLSDCKHICTVEGASFCYHRFTISNTSFYCPEIYDCEIREKCNLTKVLQFYNSTYTSKVIG